VKLGESDAEITTIGLFCLEAFNHKKLKEETKRLLGIDISKAEKIQIRKGRFTVHVDGKKYSCKTKELANAVEKRCHYCDDFSARLADISVGTVGSPNGYSTIVVRSDVGRRLLDNLDIVRVEAEKEEVRRLSKFKRERAGKNFSRLESETSRKPQGL
jgi:coenzyme F420 hydrogenase subunit beta